MCRNFLALAFWLALVPVTLAVEEPKDGFKRERKEGDTAKDALEGKSPPALQVEGWINTEGKELDLASLKGKVVVLDFWGVWCGPCRAAMPHLKELYAKHKEDGLVVIGIHTTNQGEKVAEYVQEESLPWPVAVDVEKKTVTAFKVDSYPDYYVIDRTGNLRVADLANSELDRVVEALLKE
ncbi:MAG TPA: TlpA disulfide reductase family protein [Pirellulaceae bacterium]|nr:TlpA disulfide reductase family protein [Pirellulaceae bacterium]